MTEQPMIWQTLGIPATSDVATIRKAYATRLRECHPGEDPVAFQRLRAAYETALRAARGANATLLVQQAQAQITQLEQSIAQTENQLSLLLGKNPGDIPRGVSLVAQPQYVRISSSCPRGFDDVLVRVQVGGGIWVLIDAQSAEQIERVYPQLKVVHERPGSTTNKWRTFDAFCISTSMRRRDG